MSTTSTNYTKFIVDYRLAGDQLLSTKPAFKGRKNLFKLKSQRTAQFLTLMDAGHQILAFVAGAARRQIGRGESSETHIIRLTPEAVGKTIHGYFVSRRDNPEATIEHPGYRVKAHKGGWFSTEFMDIPLVSSFYAENIPEAAYWGVLRVGPHDNGPWLAGQYRGVNSEEILDSASWKPAKDGYVMESGGSSLNARLHPKAVAYAKAYPTAWDLAIASVQMFGGMALADCPARNGEDDRINVFFSGERKERDSERDYQRELWRKRRNERRQAEAKKPASVEEHLSPEASNLLDQVKVAPQPAAEEQPIEPLTPIAEPAEEVTSPEPVAQEQQQQEVAPETPAAVEAPTPEPEVEEQPQEDKPAMIVGTEPVASNAPDEVVIPKSARLEKLRALQEKARATS